jgi:hypothetical protein
MDVNGICHYARGRVSGKNLAMDYFCWCHAVITVQSIPVTWEIELHDFCIISPIDTINEIMVGSSIDVDRAHADPLFVLMEGRGDGCFVVGNSRKDRLRASVL